MCRLLGIAGAAADARRFVLTGAENSLRHQGLANPHGTGLAGFVGGSLQLDKTAAGAAHAALLDSSSTITQSPSLVGHIRYRTVGPVNELNAHPYASLDGTMAFAHNGQIENLAQLRRELGDEIVDQIQSTNDSGLWSALVTREIADKGVHDGIGESVKWMDRFAPDSTSGNFLVVRNDGTLAGVRTHEARTLGMTPTGIEAAREGARNLGELPGWVVSSEATARDQPWRSLQVREAFEIDPQLRLRTWRLDE